MTRPLFFLFLAMAIMPREIQAQDIPVNYDEAKIPAYTLPDPLRSADGKKITTKEEWSKEQRPFLLQLYKENVYGKFPRPPPEIHFKTLSIDSLALGGKATRKQIRISFNAADSLSYIDVLLYTPASSRKPAPVCLGLNFKGNHAASSDPGINISSRWIRDDEDGVVNHRATEKSRGAESSRWPVEEMIKRGYAVATAYYGDLEPDYDSGWTSGIRTTLSERLNTAATEWSAIGAWAWGLCRIVDYLESDKAVDAKKIVLTGHSRLGKAALWAGANDQRFAIIVSNNSGEGGAALSKRWFGETIGIINNSFPHWFNAKYKEYGANPAALPVDQHILLSLMAPRPLYVASSKDDQWADPKGEFLSAKNAEPVYALFGKKGLGVKEMPAVNHPVGENIRYHIRTGKHDITLYDWTQYMNFADKHFKK